MSDSSLSVKSEDRPRVPMIAIVDYRGFRVIAMPWLPIDITTIVSGSNDSGENVYCEDPGGIMKEAARYLHLAEHKVKNKTLYSAGDVELHCGRDNRLYLIDLARAFPPQMPSVCDHLEAESQSVFCRLFRPEFMQSLKERRIVDPLSPDALSNWSFLQTDDAIHNLNVEKATRYLVKEVIPAYAKEINRCVSEADLAEALGEEPVSERVHRRGINMRHLGLVRSLIHTSHHRKKKGGRRRRRSHAPLAIQKSARDTLLVEIVSRTLKNMFRRELRENMENLVSEYKLKECVLGLLNMISGCVDGYQDFWNIRVLDGIRRRFGTIALRKEEESDLFSASAPLLFRIIKNSLRMIGMSLTEECEKECKVKMQQMPLKLQLSENRQGLKGFLFTEADLRDSDVCVKHMSILDYAQGKLYLSKAMNPAYSLQTSIRLHELSRSQFLSALRSDTLNYASKRDIRVSWAYQINASGDYEKADRLILEYIKRLEKTSLADYYEVGHPLLVELFKLWRYRIGGARELTYGMSPSTSPSKRERERGSDVGVSHYPSPSPSASSPFVSLSGNGTHILPVAALSLSSSGDALHVYPGPSDPSPSLPFTTNTNTTTTTSTTTSNTTNNSIHDSHQHPDLHPNARGHSFGSVRSSPHTGPQPSPGASSAVHHRIGTYTGNAFAYHLSNFCGASSFDAFLTACDMAEQIVRECTLLFQNPDLSPRQHHPTTPPLCSEAGLPFGMEHNGKDGGSGGGRGRDDPPPFHSSLIIGISDSCSSGSEGSVSSSEEEEGGSAPPPLLSPSSRPRANSFSHPSGHRRPPGHHHHHHHHPHHHYHHHSHHNHNHNGHGQHHSNGYSGSGSAHHNSNVQMRGMEEEGKDDTKNKHESPSPVSSPLVRSHAYNGTGHSPSLSSSLSASGEAPLSLSAHHSLSLSHPKKDDVLLSVAPFYLFQASLLQSSLLMDDRTGPLPMPERKGESPPVLHRKRHDINIDVVGGVTSFNIYEARDTSSLVPHRHSSSNREKYHRTPIIQTGDSSLENGIVRFMPRETIVNHIKLFVDSLRRKRNRIVLKTVRALQPSLDINWNMREVVSFNDPQIKPLLPSHVDFLPLDVVLRVYGEYNDVGCLCALREVYGERRFSACISQCIERGDIQSLSALLAAIPPREIANLPNGQPPLVYAAAFSNPEVVEILLAAGVDADRTDELGRSALFAAAEARTQPVVEALLRSTSVTRLSSRTRDGLTALHVAAQHDSSAIVSLLLQAGADPHVTDSMGFTPLLRACACGSGGKKTIALLLGVSKLEVRDYKHDRSPLAWTARRGMANVATMLLEKGADPNAMDKYSRTPLVIAARFGHEAVVAVLLGGRSKTRVDAVDCANMSALIYASLRGDTPVVQSLLQAGANIAIRERGRYKTAVMCAAQEGNLEVVKAIVEYPLTRDQLEMPKECAKFADHPSFSMERAPLDWYKDAYDQLLQVRDSEADGAGVGGVLGGARERERESEVDLSRPLSMFSRTLSGPASRAGSTAEESSLVTESDRETSLLRLSLPHHRYEPHKYIPSSSPPLSSSKGNQKQSGSAGSSSRGVSFANDVVGGGDVPRFPSSFSSSSVLYRSISSRNDDDVEEEEKRGGAEKNKKKENMKKKQESAAKGITEGEEREEDENCEVTNDDNEEDEEEEEVQEEEGEDETAEREREREEEEEEKEEEAKNLIKNLNPKHRSYDPSMSESQRRAVDILEEEDRDKWTALVCASRYGHRDVVQYILGLGVHPDSCISVHGNTALSLVCRYCNDEDIERFRETVTLLVNKGADVNKKNKFGVSPLMRAAEAGDPVTVAVLLEHGALIDDRQMYEQTALMHACEQGHLEVARILIRNGSDICARTQSGRTALLMAAFEGHTDVVRLLLDQAEEMGVRDRMVALSDELGRTALMKASMANAVEIVRLMISRNVPINGEDNEQCTPLIFACHAGSLACAELLLRAGADLEHHTSQGNTALIVASISGKNRDPDEPDRHLAIVELLLEYGANIEAHDNLNRTALIAASRFGALPIVHLLLERGAMIDTEGEDHKTALVYAYENGHLGVMRLLIEAGANVNIHTRNDSPLLWAASHAHLEMVRILLDHKADVKQRNRLGASALHLACVHEHGLPVVKLLCSRGADIELRKQGGRTSLMVAAGEGRLDIVRYLCCVQGANIQAKDTHGCTALIDATENGLLDMVRFLLENEAHVEVKTDSQMTPADIAEKRYRETGDEVFREVKRELRHATK